jgi:hypothetical protein
VWLCSPDKTMLQCSATPAAPAQAELCGNAIDDDCDGQVDEGFELLGTGCTSGIGACVRPGLHVCSPDRTMLLCNAMAGPPLPAELCGNAIDDDCEGDVDEGFEMVGELCDGTSDSDLCPEGTYSCSADKLSVVCSDFTSNNLELCDGADNDCNVATPDGADEPLIKVPTPCDATTDADSCNEGYWQWVDGALQCSDPGDDDTSNDPENCGGCGLPCETTNTTSVTCEGFACKPVCASPYQSCDNNSRNGCETTRANSATCNSPEDLGDVDGDDDGPGKTKTGFGEAAFKVRMRENDLGDDNAVGVVTLTNPADAQMTLCAYCLGCGRTTPFYAGGPPPFKCVTPARGESGTVRLGRADDTAGDDDVLLYIEIKYASGNSINASCGNWSMNVRGADDSTDCTCDDQRPSGSSCD